ncbi:hypothetical protein ACFP47_10335 [Nesterenkonia lacusekhoensis]|uniref:Uncharacterized protein n=1 Tax=Nesterenkonia lacusekhoensis TaxID=150832 RepID=A0ABS4T6N3_9MICC|nr:hypothetical protein [Nesterenkonia lacusekhoensis]MBP2319599.1 hypothetical protein [Nesterenkonia lacusekhoensis]
MSTEITRAASQQVSLTDKITYAEHLAQSGLLPKSYQRQPANVLLAMEYGDALGIHQMVAINEINVISGKPAMSASLMQSLARSAGHKVRVTGDAERAVCSIIRKDDPDYEHTSEWTKQKAIDSGLWGKGHWAKDPALMLKWRAIAECVRLACSEVLGGLKYTPQELMEISDQEPSQPAAPAQSAASPAAEPRTEHDPVEQALRGAWNDLERLRLIVRQMGDGHPLYEHAVARGRELAEKAEQAKSDAPPSAESGDGAPVEGAQTVQEPIDAELVEEDTNE